MPGAIVAIVDPPVMPAIWHVENLSTGGALVSGFAGIAGDNHLAEGRSHGVILRVPDPGVPGRKEFVGLRAKILRVNLVSSQRLEAGLSFDEPALTEARRVAGTVRWASLLSARDRSQVLVLERVRRNRLAICHALRSLGYAPLPASTPLEAIYRLMDSRNSIRIGIIGSTLPSAQAAEFADFLGEAFPTIAKLIAADANPAEPWMNAATLDVAVLPPTWGLSDLARALRRLEHRQR